MPWVELTSQPPAQYSNLTGFIGIRVFKVWGGWTREAILSKPEIVDSGDATNPQFLPAYDSDWMNGDAVLGTLERYEVGVISGDVHEVTAIYSDKRIRGEFDSSFQTEREEFSYYYQGGFAQPGAENDEPAKVWIGDTFDVNSTWYRIRQSRYVKLDEQQASNPIKYIDLPISRQINRLHNIGDTIDGPNPDGGAANALWARFEGADVRRLTWDRFSVSYSWVVDSGVRAINGVQNYINPMVSSENFDPNQFYVPTFHSRLYPAPNSGPEGPGTPGWLRPPFESIRSTQGLISGGGAIAPIGIERPPFFFCVMPLEIDEQGWRVLPW